MALVLIVDDSPTEVHVMKTALEKHGFDTVAAADGSECLELAKRVRPEGGDKIPAGEFAAAAGLKKGARLG